MATPDTKSGASAARVVGWPVAQIARAETVGMRQAEIYELRPNIVEADYLVRTYVPLLSEPGVDRVFWYTQVDDPNVSGWKLGPAGQRAMGIASAFITGSEPLGQFQGKDDRGRAGDDDVYEYRFARDGETVIAIWKARGGDQSRAVAIEDVAGDVARIYDLDATDLSPAGGREVPVVDGTVTLNLTERPLFVVAEDGAGIAPIVAPIWEQIRQWWEDFWAEQQADVENWWEGVKGDIEAWWQRTLEDIQRSIEEAIEEQINEALGGLCGAAAVAPFVFIGSVVVRRRRG